MKIDMSSPSSSNNSLSPHSKAKQRLSRPQERRSSSKSSGASYRSRSRSGSRSRSHSSSKGTNYRRRHRKETSGGGDDDDDNRQYRSRSSSASSSSSSDDSSSSSSSSSWSSSSRSSSSASRGNDNNSNNSNFRNIVGDKSRQSATSVSDQHQDLKDGTIDDNGCSDDLKCPPPPPPVISKTTTVAPIQIGKPGSFAKSGIQMKLGSVKTNKEPTKNITVASAFKNDSDEELEEMPPECKMRMRNIGRDTPTSSGPNSFGKTKQGFIDSKKIFEKTLRQATME